MICFTVCFNNYLAEALTLGDSLIRTGLQRESFFIFIADGKLPEIDYDLLPYQTLEICRSIVPALDRLKEEYGVVELSTAVKPSIFKYLIERYQDECCFTYLDPDLKFYHSVEIIERELEGYSILLTPHITQPIPTSTKPFENVFLNYGIYNLGFISLCRGQETRKMLDWWEQRTISMCYDDVANGLFVDQLWVNLVPLFFKNVKISFNLGLNVSYWNLHERYIYLENESYYINNSESPLVFYHFSSFDINLQSMATRGHQLDRPIDDTTMKLMTDYRSSLLENQYSYYKQLKPKHKIAFQNYLRRFLPQRSLKKNELTALLILKKILPVCLLRKISNLHNKLQILDKYEQR